MSDAAADKRPKWWERRVRHKSLLGEDEPNRSDPDILMIQQRNGLGFAKETIISRGNFQRTSNKYGKCVKGGEKKVCCRRSFVYSQCKVVK